MTFLTEWKSINLRRVASLMYQRHYERPATNIGETIKRHFYLNEEYASGEVFFEKIQEGFWMVSIEIRAKENTRYYITPKNQTGFYSANFFSGSKKIGYQNESSIHWANNHVLYLNSRNPHEIYIKEDTILKYCRLIYNDRFVSTLLGEDQNISVAAINLFNSIRNRTTVGAELFLQNRLFSILRHERNMDHYRASLFSVVYGLTTSFLKLSSIKKSSINTDSKRMNIHVMFKAVMILEAHLSKRFPGIIKLASECNISVSKLKRDFKETYGITPLNYFRNLQITYAIGTYNDREKAVKEIAADLGFKKASTFSFWYKKLYNHDNGITSEFSVEKQS